MSKLIIILSIVLISQSVVYCSEKCPSGLYTACFVNPCQFATCSNYPNAKCIPNYCGGCFANWYVDGQRVNCRATRSTNKILGSLSGLGQCNFIANCFVDPCLFAKCNSHPTAVCRANYCNGCNADFYVNNVKVTC